MATGFLDTTRRILSVAGADAKTFLQGLVTNDVTRAGPSEAVYAAMLTPQGKFLFDMIIVHPEPDRFLLDVDADQAAGLAARLSMYKLRADVKIEAVEAARVVVAWGADAGPTDLALEAQFPDPRSAALGWRMITTAPDPALAGLESATPADYAALRIAAGVPASGADLIANDTFPLDADFERIAGVDFKKGCYVGQEVTARMKHKTDRKKRLYRLDIDGPTPEPGVEVLANGKPAGKVGSAQGASGLAILRVDRAEMGSLTAGDAQVDATAID